MSSDLRSLSLFDDSIEGILPLDETVLPRVLCDSDDRPLGREDIALSAPCCRPLGKPGVGFGHAPGRASTAGVCCCCVGMGGDKDLGEKELWRSRSSGRNDGMSTFFIK